MHRRGATATSTGQLRFVTIGAQRQLTLFAGADRAGGADDDAVVPRELIYPPDQTEQQVEQHNAEDFASRRSRRPRRRRWASSATRVQVTVKDGHRRARRPTASCRPATSSRRSTATPVDSARDAARR